MKNLLILLLACLILLGSSSVGLAEDEDIPVGYATTVAYFQSRLTNLEVTL